jgi:hypothetical protein
MPGWTGLPMFASALVDLVRSFPRLSLCRDLAGREVSLIRVKRPSTSLSFSRAMRTQPQRRSHAPCSRRACDTEAQIAQGEAAPLFGRLWEKWAEGAQRVTRYILLGRSMYTFGIGGTYMVHLAAPLLLGPI